MSSLEKLRVGFENCANSHFGAILGSPAVLKCRLHHGRVRKLRRGVVNEIRNIPRCLQWRKQGWVPSVVSDFDVEEHLQCIQDDRDTCEWFLVVHPSYCSAACIVHGSRR